MNNVFCLNQSIKPFKKKLIIEGDKSLSIRWALLASQATGKSTAKNILKSEDVLNTLKCLKKLGIKIKFLNKSCQIIGNGINGFNYKKPVTLYAGNSGTLGRLLLGFLIHSKNKIILKGDKSLSKRDFLRVIKPLNRFGANIKSNSGRLPIVVRGTNFPKPIKYLENKGSAQCKSSIMLAALNTKGTTLIKSKRYLPCGVSKEAKQLILSVTLVISLVIIFCRYSKTSSP